MRQACIKIMAYFLFIVSLAFASTFSVRSLAQGFDLDEVGTSQKPRKSSSIKRRPANTQTTQGESLDEDEDEIIEDSPTPANSSSPNSPAFNSSVSESLENPAPLPSSAAPPKSRASNNSYNRSSSTSDFMMPGWNAKKITRGLGFSTNYFGEANTIIYETYTPQGSWSYYFGFSKTANTYKSTESTRTSGVAAITTTRTQTYTGVKNPYIISLGTSYNLPIYSSPWLRVRWGFFGGLDYNMASDYKTGTREEVVVSTSPNTTSIDETNYGDVKVNKTPVLNLGPVFDSFFFLRWFPNLAIGMQGGILFSTDASTSTKTSTRSRNYDRINGVDQAPTSNSSTETEATNMYGPSMATFALAGTQFNLMGNFVLRYVW